MRKNCTVDIGAVLYFSLKRQNKMAARIGFLVLSVMVFVTCIMQGKSQLYYKYYKLVKSVNIQFQPSHQQPNALSYSFRKVGE